jgi:HAE1 family hydrophobic/amphiphilic exporter-1
VSEFFVRRPIVAMVIAIVIVILGLVSVQSLPIAQYPDITPPMVRVTGIYTGANATNVEESVATPIEQKVNGVENMIYMKSVNSSDGLLNLEVSFEVGTDLDMANVLTQNRVSESMATLPDEVKRQGVPVKKKLSFPLLLITLDSPGGTYNDEFLTNYATINIIDEIARIQGVGVAEVFGGTDTDYAMRIWVRPDELAKLNLTISDLQRAIQEQNVLVPAGQLGGPPAPKNTEFTYTVQAAGRFQTPEEFGAVVVRSNADGSQVLLRDVTRIELGSQAYMMRTRTNGRRTAVIQIYQLPDANGLEVARAVKETMARVSERFPDDIEYFLSLDTTLPITAGIREIIITLFEAMALVVLVVFIFLQNFRATLIPTIAVPVSLIGAFALFPMLGFTINTLSLLGLVLAIGIVVDDAIVVALFPVIQRLNMLRLGEEQPAQGQHSGEMSDEGQHHQPAANQQRHNAEHQRRQQSQQCADAAQFERMIATDLVGHFLQQVVRAGMRRLEAPHPAHETEAGRRFQRRPL